MLTGRRMDTLMLLVYVREGGGVAPMVCQCAEMVLAAGQRKCDKFVWCMGLCTGWFLYLFSTAYLI
jgi:hypothetical protein